MPKRYRYYVVQGRHAWHVMKQDTETGDVSHVGGYSSKDKASKAAREKGK